MIVYHGTTNRRALNICREGFIPKKPSNKIWFAQSRGYAHHRARTQARRRHDRPVILRCDINLHGLKEQLGKRKVIYKNGILAIDGKIPVSVIKSQPDTFSPRSPEELVAWINRVLRIKAYKGPGKHHPGIQRLSQWVKNRLTHQPEAEIKTTELLQLAKQWLSEYFQKVKVNPDALKDSRQPKTISIVAQEGTAESRPTEDKVLDCLLSNNPGRRVKGLQLLEQREDVDTCQWCMMFLGDPSVDVRVAALRAMKNTDEWDPQTIMPLTSAPEKPVRAAAVALLASNSVHWLEWALKDPATCVRLEAVTLLKTLNPQNHRPLFELALHDPNPKIFQAAQKLVKGRGFSYSV